MVWGALLGVVGLRLGWILHFAVLSVRQAPAHERLRTLRCDFRMPTAVYGRRLLGLDGAAPSAEHSQRIGRMHQGIIESFKGLRSEALILGSLALAAWAALAAESNPPSYLTGISLELLFTGVVLTISGPLLFRMGGLRGTSMLLDTFVGLGYAAIVLWLAYAIAFVFGSSWRIAGAALAAMVLSRETIEVHAEIKRNRDILARPVAPNPPPAALPGVKVLLVGVDQPSSQRLRLALDNLAPTEFFEAADGIHAMEVATDARPHLAVVQAGSDSYGAFGLTRDLKASPELACPVIIILQRTADDWLGRWAGADATVPNDPDLFALAEVARHLLRRS